MKMLVKPVWPSRGLLVSAAVIAVSLTHVCGLQLDNPIVYVTQVPVTATSKTVVSIGGSHLGDTRSAPRGGDLMIRYPDGTKKNLTREAGYGVSSRLQTGEAIAVRDPKVHWGGQRVLFSMVVGAPADLTDASEFYWQIYEVEGLGKNDTPVITKVVGQRDNFNNIQPTYTSNGTLIFVSDQTLSGDRTLYPARDEQGGPAVTGLWSLDPNTSKLALLDHSPSGSFKPFVDSYGRVVFSRWDHLQRDAEATLLDAIDYASEEAGANSTDLWSDIFPEPLIDTAETYAHKFDVFLPWTMNQDGTGLLTMNHLGRHELGTEVKRSRADSNLVDFLPQAGPRLQPVSAPTRAGSYLHITESTVSSGKYTATDAVSSAVSAGRLVSFSAPPTKNPDTVKVIVSNNLGLARDPSFLSDGRLMGSFATGPVVTGSYGTQTAGAIASDFLPEEDNPFRVRVSAAEIDLSSGTNAVPVTQVNRSNYIDSELISFSGALWQLQPVELIASTVPGQESTSLPEPEIKMFGEAGVSPSALKRWLEENKMALLVSRNVTARDSNDRQQPYNLGVPGGASSLADGGPSYQVTNLQFFQGDYVRGYKTEGVADSSLGRRVAARVLHDDKGENLATEIPGSAKIALDGSTAMFVPSGRALTWQLTDAEGKAVVRERYWLTFQAGEMRSCANCHGNNTTDQLGRLEVTNPPIALRELLTDWKGRHPEADASVTPYEFWAEVNIAPGTPADGDHNGDGLSNFEAFVYGFGVEGTPISDSLAKPFTPSVQQVGEEQYARLNFTLNLKATGLRVTIESSSDLKIWKEAAVIEDGTLSTDGSVTVDTITSSELDARELKQFVVQGVTPLGSAQNSYFRLIFEEL